MMLASRYHRAIPGMVALPRHRHRHPWPGPFADRPPPAWPSSPPPRRRPGRHWTGRTPITARRRPDAGLTSWLMPVSHLHEPGRRSGPFADRLAGPAAWPTDRRAAPTHRPTWKAPRPPRSTRRRPRPSASRPSPRPPPLELDGPAHGITAARSRPGPVARLPPGRPDHPRRPRTRHAHPPNPAAWITSPGPTDPPPRHPMPDHPAAVTSPSSPPPPPTPPPWITSPGPPWPPMADAARPGPVAWLPPGRTCHAAARLPPWITCALFWPVPWFGHRRLGCHGPALGSPNPSPPLAITADRRPPPFWPVPWKATRSALDVHGLALAPSRTRPRKGTDQTRPTHGRHLGPPLARGAVAHCATFRGAGLATRTRTAPPAFGLTPPLFCRVEADAIRHNVNNR
jgi:hypothetical protein